MQCSILICSKQFQCGILQRKIEFIIIFHANTTVNVNSWSVATNMFARDDIENWIVSKRKHTNTKLTKHNANIYYNTPNRHEIVITIAINWGLSLCLRFGSPADNRLFTFCKFAFIAPKEIVGCKQISEAMTILFLTRWRYLLALFVDLRKE